MAKLFAGILSHPSGKVGSVVCSTWKGIRYIREYVKPGNPNTAAQQAVRAVFGAVVLTGRWILGSVIQVYWDALYLTKGGWAAYVKANMDAQLPGPWAIDNMVIASGSGESAAITAATLSGTTVTFTWSDTPTANGSVDDVAVAVIIDLTTLAAYSANTATRGDGTVDVTVPAGLSSLASRAFLFFTDSTTDPTFMSNSTGSAIT
jgi:hypothetical protein